MKISCFSTTCAEPVEIIAARLIENLHLRWNYCVFHVDEYTDEQDRTVYTVYGLYNSGNNTANPHFLVVGLRQTDKEQTHVRLEYGEVNTHGYPMQTVNWLDSRQYTEVDLDAHPIPSDIIKFCRVAHGEGAGVADWLRRTVGRFVVGAQPKSKRRYRTGKY